MIQCKICDRQFSNIGAKARHGNCGLTQEVQEKAREIYNSGKSLKETAKLVGVSKARIEWIIGDLRSPSEALRVSRKISPVLHSESTKEKMRQSRFSYLKKTKGDKTPFQRRWSREMSKLEEWFYDSVIIENSLQKKYSITHEHPEFPYFIDFAFHDIRLAVEVDGPLHLKDDRVIHDKKKDKDLLERGWRVYRIRFDECNESGKKDFLDFLEGNEIYRIPVEFGSFDFDKWGLCKKTKNYRTRQDWKRILAEENFLNIHEPRIKKILENKEILRIPERGWVNRVANLLGIKPQKVNGWMKRFCPELLP